MRMLLILAGVGQLGLSVGSLAIPRIFNWADDTANLRPLTRQVFWTYAVYIWATNVGFGLVSTFSPDWLLDHTPLARAVGAYITAYWGGRLIVQFFYFDRSQVPTGAIYKVAEVTLVSLFIFLTAVYAYVTIS